MGWTGEINTLEELEALMCDNVLPAPKYPDAYYRLRAGRRLRGLSHTRRR